MPDAANTTSKGPLLRNIGNDRLDAADLVRLRGLGFFPLLSPEAVEIVVREATIVSLPASARLFAEKTPCDRLWIVLDGLVGLLVMTGADRHSLIDMVGAGQVLGEAGLFDGGPQAMAVQAMTPVRLLVIPGASVLGILGEVPSFRRAMLGHMAMRLRRLVHQIIQLRMMTVPQRLGSYLVGLAGRRVGAVTLELTCKRQTLAGLLGVTPESLSRAFRALAAVGVRSELSKSRVVIDDIDRLRVFAQADPQPSAIPCEVEDGDGSYGTVPAPRDVVLSAAEFTMVCRSPLFAAIPQPEVRAVLEGARIYNYAVPALVFSRGDPADRLFFVLAGRVKLFVVTADGRESLIDLVPAGSAFAEAAVFGPGRMPVNAETLAGARLLVIPARNLLNRVAADPEFSRLMLASLARRQRTLIERLFEIKVRSPGQRLAMILLELSHEAEGAVTVRLPMTKASLAARVGVTAESLSRAIGRLGQYGVTCRGAVFTLADVGRLRRYSQDGEEEI